MGLAGEGSGCDEFGDLIGAIFGERARIRTAIERNDGPMRMTVGAARETVIASLITPGSVVVFGLRRKPDCHTHTRRVVIGIV